MQNAKQEPPARPLWHDTRYRDNFSLQYLSVRSSYPICNQMIQISFNLKNVRSLFLSTVSIVALVHFLATNYGVDLSNDHFAIEPSNTRRWSSSIMSSDDDLKAAAVMLVSNPWTQRRGDRNCWFNTSMDNLETYWWPNNKYPIILLATESWQDQEMNDILKHWPNLPFIFSNIENIFSTEPTRLNISNLDDVTYKRMCIFKSYGFLDMAVIRELDFIMYIDDDACLAGPIAFDVFAVMQENHIRYGFVETFRDGPGVTTGIVDYVKDYVHKNKIEYSNSVLKKWVDNAMFGDTTPTAMADHDDDPPAPPLPFAFSTNLEWIDLKSYRRPEVQALMMSIRENDYIFERRWGDAPIRFLLSFMFWSPNEVMKVCVEYFHSSWEVEVNRCPNGSLYFIDDAVLKHVNGQLYNLPSSL